MSEVERIFRDLLALASDYDARLAAILVEHNDQQTIDDLVALGIRADAELIAQLKAENQRMRDALTSLLTMDVAGHQLQDRLQFSTKGRQLLEKAQAALRASHE